MHERRRIAICPTCGRQLDERDWHHCPFCREPIPHAGEPLPPSGMMTDFGLGLFAALVSSVMTAVSISAIESSLPVGARLILLPGAAGVAAAWSASWLGRRLIRPMRRSFERIIIAAVLSLLPAATVGMATANAWAGPGTLTFLAAAIYAHIRHKPPDWGYPPAVPGGRDG